MKEMIVSVFENIKEFEFSACSILGILFAYFILCLIFVFKAKYKTTTGKKIFKVFFGIVSSFVVIVVLFKSDNNTINLYIDKINIIATITLAVVALKMSISQNRVGNFEFTEKIAFPNIKHTYQLNKIDVSNEEQYTTMKQMMSCLVKDETNIYEFVFELDKQLDPQIEYTLNNIKIYDSRVSYNTFKDDVPLQHDLYNCVYFECDMLDASKIHIVIDDTVQHFLPVLKNPDCFPNTNCQELSVVCNFTITDIVNMAFNNKELFLVFRFTKQKLSTNDYKISSIQTYVYK